MFTEALDDQPRSILVGSGGWGNRPRCKAAAHAVFVEVALGRYPAMVLLVVIGAACPPARDFRSIITRNPRGVISLMSDKFADRTFARNKFHWSKFQIVAIVARFIFVVGHSSTSIWSEQRIND